MNIPLFISSLLLLQIICFFVAKRVSKKLETQEDYFLAGRGVKFFPLLMTLIATQIGGGLVLGSAEEAYRYGWYVLLYPLGASLGLLLLAAGIGKRMAQFNVSTVAQLFEVVYRSTALKKVASLLSIISLFMILVGQVIASKKFMISLGMDQQFLFIVFWAIVLVYTVLGGLKAVVATDIIQAIFFIAVFILCISYSLMISPVEPSTVLQTALNNEAFVFDASKLCGWLLMPLLFMVIEQDMAQRCFAAKSGKVVSLATAFAAVCIMLVCAIPVYYGILAKSLGMTAPTEASVLMTVINDYTTPSLAALIGCAILAAIISTADSLINAISSNIAQDFDFSWKSSNQKVKTAQFITAIIGVLAFLFSAYFNNVVDILIQSYELSVSCLFAPIFIALFKKRGQTNAALFAIVAGAFGFVFLRWFPIVAIPREVASLVLSFAGYGIGELLSKKTTVQVETPS